MAYQINQINQIIQQYINISDKILDTQMYELWETCYKHSSFLYNSTKFSGMLGEDEKWSEKKIVKKNWITTEKIEKRLLPGSLFKVQKRAGGL